MPSKALSDVDSVLFSVDPVIFSLVDGELHILAVKRHQEPFKGIWGLPGGRVDKSCENLDQALALKLEHKTGLKNVYFEQMQTYGSSGMDPRGWSVTTSYIALVHRPDLQFKGHESDELMQWLPLQKVVDGSIAMAFWHTEIVTESFERLRSKSLYTDLPVNLMPKTFSFASLRLAYEVILGFPITRQGFVRRMEDAGIFQDTGEKEYGSNRPSTLYRKKTQGGSYYFPREIQGK